MATLASVKVPRENNSGTPVPENKSGTPVPLNFPCNNLDESILRDATGAMLSTAPDLPGSSGQLLSPSGAPLSAYPVLDVDSGCTKHVYASVKKLSAPIPSADFLALRGQPQVDAEVSGILSGSTPSQDSDSIFGKCKNNCTKGPVLADSTVEMRGEPTPRF